MNDRPAKRRKLNPRTIPDFFPCKFGRQKQGLPKDIRGLIFSFVKPTTKSEIETGVQRTMTEFLDDNYVRDHSVSMLDFDDACFDVWACTQGKYRGYGPFRHLDQAITRAESLVRLTEPDSVVAYSYDSRYLDDRKGLWTDTGTVFIYNRESAEAWDRQQLAGTDSDDLTE